VTSSRLLALAHAHDYMQTCVYEYGWEAGVNDRRQEYKHDAKQVEDSLEHCVTNLANPRRCRHALWNAAEAQEAGFAHSGQWRTNVQEIAPSRECS